jgi:Mce-associated membrane protein
MIGEQLMRRIRSPFSGGQSDRLQHLVFVLALAVVVGGGAAGYGWYNQNQRDNRDGAARACLAAATPASQAIFSYDYRSFDAGVAKARSFITGDFVAEYAKTTDALKPTAINVQAVVQAQVSAAGVVDVTNSRVEVLVYLNQYRRNVNITGEKVDQDRVVLSMVPGGRDCRVAAASAI